MHQLSLTLQIPSAIVLLIVLVFNMTQRKNAAAGTRKRLATLILGGILFFFHVTLIFLYRNFLPDKYIIFSGLVTAGSIVLFRKYIFIFRNKCVDCGKKVGFYRTFYFDNPRCRSCEKPLLKTGPKKEIKTIIIPTDIEQIDWESWDPDEKAVLCFIRKKDEILLIHKKSGLGAGKINAPGGRIEKGETPAAAAAREVKEEVHLDIRGPEYCGELYFQFTDGLKLHCTVFSTENFSGTEEETGEAAPFWCKTSDIPYDKMWEDDGCWIPLMLEKKKFTGYFVFKDDDMLSYKIKKQL